MRNDEKIETHHIQKIDESNIQKQLDDKKYKDLLTLIAKILVNSVFTRYEKQKGDTLFKNINRPPEPL